MTFVFRPGLTVVTAISLALLCALGAWQLQRLEWKRDLIAKVHARLAAAPIPFEEALARAEAGEDMEYQPVRIEGVYAHSSEAHIFGTLDGTPGYYLFTPFRASGAVAYVNRGFVPQTLETASRTDPVGETTVIGLFRSAEAPAGVSKALRPRDQPEDNLYFVRDPRLLAEQSGLDVPPYYVDSSGAENAGPWPKGGVTRVEFSNRHLEYALTWFGLGAALLGVYFVYSLRKA